MLCGLLVQGGSGRSIPEDVAVEALLGEKELALLEILRHLRGGGYTSETSRI